MNIVTSILFSVFRLVSAAQTADEPQPFVRSGADQELRLDLRDDAETEGANGVIWKLSVESAAVPDQPDAKDYHLTWTVTKGQVESASVGIVFEFKDWSPENFVFVPAAVYNGNRFDIKRIGYPPYWYDPNEWRIDAHSCGAVWANVQNKHGAPAICTWSGDSLLKYYRATGDRRALDLLTDIAHGVPQYISRIDHRIGRLKPGEMCERVNLSAWEGQRNVGGSIFGSCTWVETAAMLTVTQLPGLYVQPDTGLAVAFDNVCIEELSHAGKTVKFRLTNPTNFATDVSVLVESVEAARRPMGSFVLQPLPLVHLDAGTSTTLEYTVSRSSSIEAEAADTIGGASKTADSAASGGDLVSLTKPGQGVRFTGLPAASKLAIRYASVEAGTISVAVNDQPARRVNVHSSGALTGSFLHAILDVAVPANAMLTISLAADDVPVNIDWILVGDGDLGLPPDIWNLPPLKVADGPYAADWKALSRVYTVPQWWRDAKFGAWAHWDPQSMPERGDWYARGMYIEGSGQYNYHLSHFGHPSEYGYKDICNNWVIDRWKPEELMDLFVEMGARYFMAMGVHHDNFDCWDSAYQPWNSVHVGPKVDIVGTWEKAARRHGLRFGIGFHNSPPRTWGQFMPVRYTSDKKGPKQGVPYDALQTILDGKGKWWEGMDPVDLYGPVHNNKNPLLSPFANQFMWRVDDAVTKYHPDVIYFDEAAGDTLVDLGVKMGLGFLAPPLVANYYNKSLKWNQGKMDVVINLKCVGGRYNSFKNTPELIPIVERALVKSTEADIEPEIRAYPFQTETTIQDWHYRAGQGYIDAKRLVQALMENVSRNGTMLLNLTQHGRGNLDPQVIRICKDIGAWLKINGEAVYGSRPFEICGENSNSICYTRNNGNVYATLLAWQGGPIKLKALHAGGATLGKVSKVELLGSDIPLTFVHDDQGLTVTPGASVEPLPGIANQQLASEFRILRITHDKGWFNDDDPGATYPGWIRRCNLGTGDFNNDLTTCDTPGDVWACRFTGSSVSVIAPKEAGAGKIEIQIDGETRATADLSTTGMRQAQQEVCEVSGLTPGKHAINIVNRGPGPVALDAIIVR